MQELRRGENADFEQVCAITPGTQMSGLARISLEKLEWQPC